jgi:uncharacterized alkaline shock family protein YloU
VTETPISGKRPGRRAGLGYYNTVTSTSDHRQPADPPPAGEANGARRRRIGELARQAAVSSYGVVAVRGPRWYHGLLSRLGRGVSGVRVSTEPRLRIQLYLALAPGVPVAQVASNVEQAVRYLIRRELGRSVDELAIHVGGRPVATAGGGQDSLGRS